MVTMTISPITYANVVIDENYKDDKLSINDSFIENTTNITNQKFNTNLLIIKEVERVNEEYFEYETSSMNNYYIGEDMNRLYYYCKQQIEIYGRKYFFKNSFVYVIRKEEEIFVAENNLFNIYGYGNTIFEAEQQLYETIDDLWNVYVEEDDKNLDEGALKLKREILENVRKIY